jgi:sulfofructosephosphate aldolase
VLSVLEGVVKLPGTHSGFNDALLEAAQLLGSARPDVYKTQVPCLGHGTPEEVTAISEQLTEVVGVPWVALSNGFTSKQFPDAVTAVCRGGASGFLAGRATWAEAVSSEDPHAELATLGVDRLQELCARVDADARPWWTATGFSSDHEAEVSTAPSSAGS